MESSTDLIVVLVPAMFMVIGASYHLAALLLHACATSTAARAWPGAASDNAVPNSSGLVIAAVVVGPNVLLSVIELVANDMIAEDGRRPTEVVDLGAFGVLGIGAACALAVPGVRKVASPHVAMVLVCASAAAQVLLALVLKVTSPNVVEVWEVALMVCLLPVVALCLPVLSARGGPPLGVAYALTGEAKMAPDDEQPHGGDKQGLCVQPPTYIHGLKPSVCARRCRGLVPPSRLCGGWLAVLTCLAYASALAALASDLASTLGCMLRLPSALSTCVFGVALSNAVPLCCAIHAARRSGHADLSIAIVTGLSLAAVSLGLGVPWLIAATYWRVKDTGAATDVGAMDAQRAAHPTLTGDRVSAARAQPAESGAFVVAGGRVGMAVASYCACVLVGVGWLAARRVWKGAELGGSKCARRCARRPSCSLCGWRMPYCRPRSFDAPESRA